MKRILAIDGGGIRGVIPASFCLEIECLSEGRLIDMFDLIAGTSTGGIIALALAKPTEGQVTGAAKDILALYVEKGPNIFSQPKGFLGNILRPKYSVTALEKALQDYFGETKLSQASAHVMVTCYDMAMRRPRVLKSWDNQSTDYLMREAARATSAAPTFFPPASLEDNPLVDGGIFANNPAGLAFSEAKRLWPDEDLLLVSIGTGSIVAEAATYNKIKQWGFAGWAVPLLHSVFDGTSASTDDVLKHLLPTNRY